MSNHTASWRSLYNKISAAQQEAHTTAGVEPFYRSGSLREVLEWMDEMESGNVVVPTADLPDRLVCGTGVSSTGTYEVVRRVRSKEYRIEHSDGTWKKVSLSEAVNLVEEPFLNTPGLSAFDKAYEKMNAVNA